MRGGEPPNGGHSQSHPRSKRDTSPSLQQTTRDRVKDDVSPVVSIAVVEDATLMQQLQIGSPSLEIQQQVETFLTQSAPPPAQVAARQNEPQQQGHGKQVTRRSRCGPYFAL